MQEGKELEYVDISKLSNAAVGEICQIPKDGAMASTSDRTALEECPALPIVHFGSICSPLRRLSRLIKWS